MCRCVMNGEPHAIDEEAHRSHFLQHRSLRAALRSDDTDTASLAALSGHTQGELPWTGLDE